MSRERFLAALAASPEDDSLRLVFADWLEEQREFEAARSLRWYAGYRVELLRAVRVGDDAENFLAISSLTVESWKWPLGALGALAKVEELHVTPPRC